MPVVIAKFEGRWRSTLMLFALFAAGGCQTVEYRINDFTELIAEPTSDLRITLSAHGSWKRLDTPEWVEVNGSPYTMDMRITASKLSNARLAYLRVIDPITGSSMNVVGWDEPVVDRSNGTLAIIHRRGVDLPANTVRVEAELVVYSGETTDTIPFSGHLKYTFRIENRNRILEHVRGL